MNIFEHLAYRPAFAELFRLQRQLSPSWSTAGLAERIGVRASHITNVIKERGHFSSDQIYAIGQDLQLGDEKIEYLDLLKEWERAGFRERKEKLREALDKIRNQNLRSHKVLESEPAKLLQSDHQKYYLDPNIELIHLYLETAGAPSDTVGIANAWGLSVDYVSDILVFLQESGLIELQRGRWRVHPIRQLLPSTSPIQKPQQLLKRMRAIEVMQKRKAEHIYTFSAALTMSEETRLKIQARWLEFLKWTEKAVIASPPDAIYHLQFDLFPWIEPKKK